MVCAEIRLIVTLPPFECVSVCVCVCLLAAMFSLSRRLRDADEIVGGTEEVGEVRKQ